VFALVTAGRVCVKTRWGLLFLYAQIERLRPPLVVCRRLRKKRKKTGAFMFETWRVCIKRDGGFGDL